MMKLLLITCLIFVGISPCSAQYTSDITAIDPVTPNEAAMFKPVAQPTGSFSGVVSTDIPLFTLGMPNLPVPVTLSYNSSGFKVEEYASSVGLGWNLGVGGSITRVVHGLADDIPDQGFANHPDYKPSQILGYGGYYWSLEPPLNEVREGFLDLEPDEYFYTCNGLSGKFHFDENRNVVVENASGITILATFGGPNNQIVSWTLTDTKGNVYYFGPTYVDQNSVTYSSSNGYTNIPPNQIYNIDWHLQKITDMNGHDMADFDYDQNPHDYSTRLQAYTKIWAGSTIGCDAGVSYNSDETFTSSTAYESVLTSITTPIDKLTIYGDRNRTDDQGGWRVDSIRQTDINGNLKKMFHFNYSYFYQPGIPSGDTSFYQRLKLLNISEWGTGTSDSLTHSFGYYTGYNLPSRVSRGQDYWGFYNAQDANWTLMANGTYPIPGGTVSEGTLGERRPCFPCSEADMLTSVTYPTGGTRTFTYEANQYLWDPGSTSTPDQSYFQTPTIYANTDSFNTSAPVQYQSLFTVNSLAGGTTWNFYIDGCCYFGSYSVTILDQYGYTTIASFSNLLSGSISLSNGTYMLQFSYDVYNVTIYDFNAYWSQLQMDTASIVRYDRSLYKDNMTGPGVRVKQVTDYDPVSGQTITTNYQYNLFTDSTLSSGLLLTPTSIVMDMSCLSCEYIRLGAASNYPLSEQGGSYVNYTDVRTYQTGNGRTDRKFSFDYDVPQNGDYEPFLNSLLDNSWRRGQLLSTRYYDNSGNLLRLDSTAYNVVGANTTWWLSPTSYPDTTRGSNFEQAVTLGYKVHAWIDPVLPGTLDYCYDPYYLTSQFLVPDSTVSYIYSPAGTQYERTAFTYYDSLLHPLLHQDQHYVNDSFTVLHDYRYAFDANSAFLLGLSSGDISMKSTLLGLNYFQPLEVTTRKQRGADTSFVEGMHYGFGSFPIFHSTYYYPNLVRHYTTLQNYRDVNLVTYDSLGHLAEEYKTGDPHTVWLWGYNYTRPVAKIVGSTYSTAMSFINNLTLQFPSSDNDIRTQVNAVRTGLTGAKALVTTYTYSTVFGMTSMVDAAGTITYYDYDSHGRLQDVRDANNNIVKRYSYTINN